MASKKAMAEISSWPYVERVEPIVSPYDPAYDREMFPPNRGQTPDNYGPIWLPEEGQRLDLTDENWPMYSPIIQHFENRTVERRSDGTFWIDGVQTTEYTFSQGYYFMIGDNRDNSLDSRFWGFVPADHIMGKAVATFFSWDKEQSRPRLDRVMKLIR